MTGFNQPDKGRKNDAYYADLARAFGRVEGQLEQVISHMKKADKHRETLHQNIQTIKADIGDLRRHENNATRRFDQIEERTSAVEKPVAEFNKWRERATGAVMLVSMIAALVGGALAASWHKILEVFK